MPLIKPSPSLRNKNSYQLSNFDDNYLSDSSKTSLNFESEKANNTLHLPLPESHK